MGGVSETEKRLAEELDLLRTTGTQPWHTHTPGYTLTLPDEADPYHWEVTLLPPNTSAYHGGHLALRVAVPATYPASPPRLTFTSPVFHPNIDTSGQVAAEVLVGDWNPALMIDTLLRSLLTLLDEPNVRDPLRPEAAELYVLDPAAYREQARMSVTRPG